MLKFLLALILIALSVNTQANNTANYSEYLNAAVSHFVQNNDEGEITLTLKFKKPLKTAPVYPQNSANYYPNYHPAYRIETRQDIYYSQQWRYIPH